MTAPATPSTLLVLAAQSAQLTARQREVFELAQAQLPNAEIALRLGLSVNTVRSHLKAALRKLAGRRRSGRRADDPPLSRTESALLVAMLQSPLVGELARQVKMKPLACRRLLESIVRKVARMDATASAEGAEPATERSPALPPVAAAGGLA